MDNTSLVKKNRPSHNVLRLLHEINRDILIFQELTPLEGVLQDNLTVKHKGKKYPFTEKKIPIHIQRIYIMNYNLALYGEMNPSQQLKHLRHLNVLMDPLN